MYDLTASRIRYGRQVGLFLPAPVPTAKIAEVLKPHRMPEGLPLAMRLKPGGVECTIQLGDDWLVAPSDALTLALEQVLGAKEVAIEY